MNLPQIEERILKFWDKKRVFKKSIAQRKGSRFFSFYDGPPFASGPPHYGHILATTIKDAVLRYFTMRGYRVERRVGWDCHGLPVENLIEKELGIKNKRDIEKLGIAKFNQVCQASVFRCVKDWEVTLKRVGRWADYSHAYATMDKEYTESVWWVFKQLYDANLIYSDFRVLPYCPRCGTPLSNFELNQPGAYRDVEDQSVYLKFPIKGEKGNFFLVWTTTPWTLPANTALAVGEKINYVKVRLGDEKYILAKERLAVLDDKEYEIENEFLGGALVGREYEPLYEMKLDKPGWRVAAADFVSTADGTGIVHIAPAFGEDDMNLGKKEDLPLVVTVDLEGKIKKDLGIPGEGKFVKTADEDIKADLKKRKFLFKEEKITHSYPHCWRCDSPLLYYPLNSWFVAVSQFKEALVANNQQINWNPGHLKEGRFGKWLEGARDWAISRNRFWGAPLPVWTCQKCGQVKVVGSLKELGKKISNLHRPHIDKIIFKCSHCDGEMRRVEEVFDCWFESGAMPYAQWHYPFENKKLAEETFPADFIAEGIDQTRGWFYTLHVLAAALTLNNIGLGQNKPAFQNAIVNGLILAEDGKKLSKKLRNYTPPEDIFAKYGADTLRYFLLTSTPIGDDYIISDRRIEETYRRTIATLWHTFSFYKTYTERKFKPRKNFEPKNILDRWILSRLNNLTQEIIAAMNNYDLTNGARPLDPFIDDLSNWYVRRSRRRLQKPENAAEKSEAAQTLYLVLLNLVQLAAPFMPFLTDEIYLWLRKPSMPESVHLCDFPKANKNLINEELEKSMATSRAIVAQALAERAAKGIKVRQPLQELKIKSNELKDKQEFLELIKDEVNVKEVVFDAELKTEIKLETKITKELAEEGAARELARQIQEMRKVAGLTRKNFIAVHHENAGPKAENFLKKWGAYLKKENLAREILPHDKDVNYLAQKTFDLAGEKIKIAIRKVK
ncbi:MAG: Isoleucine-tRNA ligase [Parcubacteria group bacterium GW2011_GWC2_42_6]|nr:MAG: Isoleucine-tRNA ligase [Parcubacteria group bacterium GW2011_GWA2_42_11]KKS67684.1 MAG: Isoleucine-tRNA ligase [Parcubacteria group bacterium GW2011_GWC2_42_6]